MMSSRRKILLLALLFSAGFLPAALTINDSGSFTIGELRGRFKCAAGKQWRSAIQDNQRFFTVVKRDGERLESRLEMKPELAGTLRQSFRPTGELSWDYELEFAEDAGYEAVHIAVDFSAEAKFFVNRELLVDGKSFTFPPQVLKKENPFHLLWQKAREVSFVLNLSTVTFVSDTPFGVLLQDDRAAGGNVFTVRLVLLEKDGGGRYHQRFTVSEKPHKDKIEEQNKPVVFGENAQWRPVRIEKDVLADSILDFSGNLDAPAGKYGPVVVRNGHFEFRDRPGQPVRFYGTNLVDTAQFLTPEWAEKLAERLARAGFNLVRLHHHDNGLSLRSNGDSTALNSANLESLNYLVACLKKRGIYIITDCYVSRTFTPEEISAWGTDDFKTAVLLNGNALENWKRFVCNWFSAVNPHTGLPLKSEPALIGVTLVNEGCIGCKWNEASNRLLHEQFRQWQRQNRKSMPIVRTDKESVFYDPLVAQFVLQLYSRTFTEMRDFLRNDLGMPVPVSDRSMHAEWLSIYMRTNYDFVDNHYYFDHPRYPYTAWRLPGTIKNISALGVPLQHDLTQIFASRIYARPFALTEFDYPKPNFYRAEGGVLPAAYAGLQDWDALVQFACSHGDFNIIRDQTVGGSFDLYSDVVKLLSHRIGVKLFLGRQISPAPVNLITLFSSELREPMSFSQLPSADLRRVGLVARLSTAVVSAKNAEEGPISATAYLDAGCNFPEPAPDKHPVFRANSQSGELVDELLDNGILPRNSIENGGKRFRATGGQLLMDTERQTFSAVGSGINVLILPEDCSGKAGLLHIGNRLGRAVFSLQSADDTPLQDAERLLFLHLTDSQASGMTFDSAQMKQFSSYGKDPHLAACGEAEVSLDLKGEYDLYSCDTAGRRLARIPLTAAADGTLHFTARVFREEGCVFVYELVRRQTHSGTK